VKCALGVMLGAMLVVGGQGQEIMPLSEVVPGMTGVGKTVVAGDLISLFTVVVVGIIDEPGEELDFIVVRASGDAISEAGGVAMGMSGSPIYIEGRLVGALSRAAAWAKSPEPIALITPIEQMLELVGALSDAPSQPRSEAILPGVKVVDVADLAGLIPEDPQVMYALPVTLPLVVSGISGRALDLLRTGGVWRGKNLAGLESRGLRFLPLSGGRGTRGGGSPLVPGGAVGVALATGDVTLGALGTLTWRQDDVVLAFGHPFLFGGEVSLPLTRASVMDTIEAYDISFKLGSLGETVGAALQDRWAGIGARLQAVPDTISLEVTVRDLDRQKAREFKAEIARLPEITDFLLLIVNLHAQDATLNRIGPGTSVWRCELMGKGLPRPVVREDVLTSLSDVSSGPLFSIWQLLREISRNPFAEVELERVKVEFAVTQEIQAIQIIDLTLDRDSYSPGDVIEFAVELQTFYGELQTVTGQLQIPTDLDAFEIEVRAYAGVPWDYSPPPHRSIEEFVDELEGRPTNFTLVVELVTWDRGAGLRDLEQEAARRGAKRFVSLQDSFFGGLDWMGFGMGFFERMLTLARVEQKFPGYQILGQATELVVLEREFEFDFPRGTEDVHPPVGDVVLTPADLWLVRKMAEAYLDVETFQFDMEQSMDMTTVAYGETIDMQTSSVASAKVDIAAQRTMMAMTMETTMPPMPGVPEKVMEVQMKMYSVDGMMYMGTTVPDMPPLWSKMQMPWMCPLALSIELLKVSVVEVVGVEQVNGVESYVIKITPDLGKLWELMMKMNPGMVPPEPLLDIRVISMKQWIARDTFLPIREQLQMTMVFEGMETETTIISRYHSFNDPVTIQLPPEAEGAIEEVPMP